jgi:O-antigen/teichoic acid export membrane protein
VDVLRTPRAGALAIRGGALRAGGYAVGVLLGAATSVFLLRGLGVEDFGRFATVTALLGIVATVSDAGLSAVGARELSLRRPGPEREELLRTIVGARVLLLAAGVAAATLFALAAGYDRVMVWGVLLGGLGVLLVYTQATAMLPLAVDLRIGALTAVEVLRGAITLAGVAALALAGASLLPFFAVQLLVGVAVVALTPALLGSARALRPSLARADTLRLLRITAPVGVAVAMNVIYLRLLVVMVELGTSSTETGLYATAFRVVELLAVVPPLVVGVAVPLLAVAGADRDRERLRYGVQRLVETAAAAALGLALVATVLAEPALELLGGADYAGAATMLRIQVWALAPLALGSVLSVALVSLHRQRALALGNAAALVVVLAAGAALIAASGGEGAAVAGILAEAVLAAALLAFLARAEPDALPSLRFLWRPLLALGAGLATLLVPLPRWVDGLAAATAFAAVALLVRAFPPEILEALRRRAPGDRP